MHQMMQIVDNDPVLAHDPQGDLVVTLHVLLESIESRLALCVSFVVNGCRGGKNESGFRLLLQSGDNAVKVLLIGVEIDLVRLRRSRELEVVQTDVEVNEIGLVLEDEVIEVLRQPGAIADDVAGGENLGLTVEHLRHGWRVADANGVADKDDLWQSGFLLGASVGEREGGQA